MYKTKNDAPSLLIVDHRSVADPNDISKIIILFQQVKSYVRKFLQQNRNQEVT